MSKLVSFLATVAASSSQMTNQITFSEFKKRSLSEKVVIKLNETQLKKQAERARKIAKKNADALEIVKAYFKALDTDKDGGLTFQEVRDD